MKKLRIKQIRSGIGRPVDQKRTLQALGFKKLNQVREIEARPEMLGMVNKVKHLLLVEEID
ncbi:MAG TPA: 50S ribosomal protein L30 [Bacteroidales bacterium]|jgi:large subunit ribosomal protein L30|nr:50S ribosomal protein L30 [Lentimicrobiaceae bacterium]HOH99936.1 50S ribosomal protein L30 [Bacteroidales bacterium]